jgi:DNA (cytosine-5)-methyltransferase 1
MVNVGSDFSGVGAFDQALRRLNIDYKTVFSCDMDKYARETFIHNYGEPYYYPENVYDREIPKQSLDIYMTSPPCQAFSLAGKRKGEDDKRGVLFYNSHEFIVKNKPRYFIFENVKGLLSDDNGKTFQRWIDMLGGKSVNGNPVIFPREDATPYHIYFKVLNAKNYGVPQNRERVFIIGIRDDSDNNFNWPKKQHLTKRLKDVLEVDVDQKYYLSDKMINYLHQRSDNFNNGKVNFKDENDTASCITKSSSSLDISDNIIKVGNTNPSGNGMNGNVFDAEGISPTLSTNKGEGIKAMIGAIRGRNPENPLSREVGLPTEQRLELNMNGTSNALTTVQKDNVVVTKNYIQYDVSGKGYKSQQDRLYYENGVMCTIPSARTENKVNVLLNDFKIRRLTPRECFRLMDFPDTFTWPVSNSQAYKQAGNSIVVNVLAEIIKKLKL